MKALCCVMYSVYQLQSSCKSSDYTLQTRLHCPTLTTAPYPVHKSRQRLTVCHAMVRFAIGACSLQDLAQEANVKAILAPTPKSVDRNRSCRRAYLQRFFEVWRAHTAQHASKSRRACNFPQHLLITSSAQFSGNPPALTHTVSHTKCHESSCLLAVMLI